MKNKMIALFLVLGSLISGATGYAQGFGEIQMRLFDEEGLPVDGAVVRAEDGATIRGGATDHEGRLRIGALPAGLYTLRMSYTGKAMQVIDNVRVLPDQITRFMNVVLRDSTFFSGGVEKVEYINPLIDSDGGTMLKLTAKELKNLPSANGGNIKAIVISMSSDIKASPSGNELYFRGSRAGSTVYFIDGIKIRENVPNIPSSGLSSISVYTGGVPAKYGDSTGGYVVIETKSYREDYYERRSGSR